MTDHPDTPASVQLTIPLTYPLASLSLDFLAPNGTRSTALNTKWGVYSCSTLPAVLPRTCRCIRLHLRHCRPGRRLIIDILHPCRRILSHVATATDVPEEVYPETQFENCTKDKNTQPAIISASVAAIVVIVATNVFGSNVDKDGADDKTSNGSDQKANRPPLGNWLS
jgi:hypothetical protein